MNGDDAVDDDDEYERWDMNVNECMDVFVLPLLPILFVCVQGMGMEGLFVLRVDARLPFPNGQWCGHTLFFSQGGGNNCSTHRHNRHTNTYMEKSPKKDGYMTEIKG